MGCVLLYLQRRPVVCAEIVLGYPRANQNRGWHRVPNQPSPPHPSNPPPTPRVAASRPALYPRVKPLVCILWFDFGALLMLNPSIQQIRHADGNGVKRCEAHAVLVLVLRHHLGVFDKPSSLPARHWHARAGLDLNAAGTHCWCFVDPQGVFDKFSSLPTRRGQASI